MKYFEMTPAELTRAEKILRTFELNIERYDLDYGYDEDLNEDPDVPEDMNDYADTLIAHARVEMQKPEDQRLWSEIAKNLGLAGALRKITGQIDEASKLLSYSLYLCEEFDLPANLRVQQAIRLADVKKREGHLEEALADLEELQASVKTDPTLAKYEDVLIQHIGKVHFAMGDYVEALKQFEHALSMRIKKGDEELISSTRTAITACRARLV